MEANKQATFPLFTFAQPRSQMTKSTPEADKHSEAERKAPMCLSRGYCSIYWD